MHLTEAPSTENRKGLRVAVAATVVVTGSLSWLAFNKHSGDSVSAEQLAKTRFETAAQLRGSADSEVDMFKLTIKPGGSGGWHSHPGQVLVTVTQGNAVFYEAAGSSCTRKVVKSGKATVEQPGVVHVTRNEGKRDLIIHGVNIRPQGTKPGVWEARPAECHH